ncbi:MAG TPA: ABC transporter permease [Casimicrobiaceae bacterium]|jgi:simple sugar transport system permease protein|nr:ABC transporter permease [Casimicrobiaceae bacterium]
MRLALETRPQPSRVAVWLAPLLATLATLIIGFIVFKAFGKDPVAAFNAFFVQPVATLYGVAELLLKATPLMMIATGLAIGYRANVWNIGAEGQLTMGAIAGGGVALLVGEEQWPAALLLPAMFVCGALAGMLWAAIPAWLRTRFNANEILTSLMLVYVATLFLSWLIHGPWRDPEGYNFPQSKLFTDNALLPILITDTRLNASLLLALAITAIAWLFVRRHIVGFEMRVAGLAPAAAHYAGIDANRNVWLGMLAGGACAGLAGVGEAAGPIGQLLPSMSPGYGFAAIIVAFVGRLHPLGIVFASVLMSLLYLGGESAQVNLALPSAVTGLFQGTLLFFLLAADVLVNYRVRVVQPRVMG